MPSTTPKIHVGVTGSGYNEIRNIIDLPFSNVTIGRHRDPIQLLDLAYFKLTGKLNLSFHAIHNDLGLARFDVLHFFNKVSLSKTPWLSTFESFIPRLQSPSEKLYRTILDPSCVGLIAISNGACRMEWSRLERFTHLRDDIMKKIQVLHPAQRPGISSIAEKPPLAERVKLIMVGHEFFRKGGLETLRAIDRLLQINAPLHLTIISQLKTQDYVSYSGEKELTEAKRIIAKYPGNITYFHTLGNAAVLELFKDSDIALLPTYDDTYGYSVLEAQAYGCPVITTNVVSLPEINSNAVGWLVDLPITHTGEGDWRTRQGKAHISRAIEDQLVDHLEKIIASPDVIRIKGEAALERIRNEHTPASRAAFLETMYTSAMHM